MTPTQLETVTVTGNAADLLGTALTATKGQASAAEIQARPYLRSGLLADTFSVGECGRLTLGREEGPFASLRARAFAQRR